MQGAIESFASGSTCHSGGSRSGGARGGNALPVGVLSAPIHVERRAILPDKIANALLPLLRPQELANGIDPATTSGGRAVPIAIARCDSPDVVHVAF